MRFVLQKSSGEQKPFIFFPLDIFNLILICSLIVLHLISIFFFNHSLGPFLCQLASIHVNGFKAVRCIGNVSLSGQVFGLQQIGFGLETLRFTTISARYPALVEWEV